MGKGLGQIGCRFSPEDRMVHARTSYPQHKVAGGMMHHFDRFEWPLFDHPADSGHSSHPSPELQISLFLYINTSLFIHAVLFPDRRVFYGMIVMNGKTLPWLQRQHKRFLLRLDLPDGKLQAAWKKPDDQEKT